MTDENKFITNEPNWIRDEPKVWEMDGKSLEVKGGRQDGVYIMHVSKQTSDGFIKPGYVIVTIVEKHD